MGVHNKRKAIKITKKRLRLKEMEPLLEFQLFIQSDDYPINTEGLRFYTNHCPFSCHITLINRISTLEDYKAALKLLVEINPSSNPN